ncbi:hypothetical protein Hanom_Chr00s002435g01700031 [Helianthus anomalus]
MAPRIFDFLLESSWRTMRKKMRHCLLRHHLSPLDRHAAVARNEGPSLVNKRGMEIVAQDPRGNVSWCI